MTIVEAIKTVMREAGKPLSAREAYAAIVARSLYSFQAKDPQHVVLMQIRRHCKGIDFPSAAPTKHFETRGDNLYSALDHIERDVELRGRRRRVAPFSKARKLVSEIAITAVEKQLWRLHARYLAIFEKRMLQELKKLSPTGFEAFAQELLETYGFEDTHVTSVSRDGGIDGYGKLKVGLAHLNVAFQCKKWANTRIQRPEIDRFRGAAQGAYEQGIFFTTSSFSGGAIGASIRAGAIPIVLIDGASIVKLMIERKLRVESSLMEIPAFAL